MFPSHPSAGQPEDKTQKKRDKCDEAVLAQAAGSIQSQFQQELDGPQANEAQLASALRVHDLTKEQADSAALAKEVEVLRAQLSVSENLAEQQQKAHASKIADLTERLADSEARNGTLERQRRSMQELLQVGWDVPGQARDAHLLVLQWQA